MDAFEKEFAEKVGIDHAVAVSSGTAAMHLGLRILGIGLGGEVIASTLTFIGGVTPILFRGLPQSSLIVTGLPGTWILICLLKNWSLVKGMGNFLRLWCQLTFTGSTQIWIGF